VTGLVSDGAFAAKRYGRAASEDGRLTWVKLIKNMAAPQIETVSAAGDKVKLGLAAALVVAALAGFYLLSKQGSLVQWGGLIAGLTAAVVVFFTAEAGKELVAFGRDALREVKKVVWPERREAMQLTAYVFGFVLIMALFLWLTDKTLEWLFYDLILGWRK
jgi:preprotein translocase subunit SecE